MRSGMCHMHSFLKSGKQAWGQVLATCAASPGPGCRCNVRRLHEHERWQL